MPTFAAFTKTRMKMNSLFGRRSRKQQATSKDMMVTQETLDAGVEFPISSAPTAESASSSSHSDMYTSTVSMTTSLPTDQADDISNSPTQSVTQHPRWATIPPAISMFSSSVSTPTRTMRDNIVYATAILKDLGEILEKIPYVKALAGTTLVILRMREEMEDVDDLTSEVVEDVWRRSVELIETLKTFTTEDGQCLFHGRLESQLQSYQTLLENIAADLISLKQQPSVVRLAKRLEYRKMIERHRRRMQGFDSAFSAAVLVTLLSQVDKVVERNEGMQQVEPAEHAPRAASQASITSTMTFVVNELMHQSLVATDLVVMRHFVAGDDPQMLLKRRLLFFFDPLSRRMKLSYMTDRPQNIMKEPQIATDPVQQCYR